MRATSILRSSSHRRWSASLAVLAGVTATAILFPASAQAAPKKCSFPDAPAPTGITCTTDTSSGSKVTVIKSGAGTTLRAIFYDDRFRNSGDRIEYYGGGSCSASTNDTDFKLSSLPDGWNDKVSRIRDFAACDVDLFEHVNFKGESTGYVDYAGGKDRWTKNDWASSFKIS